MRLWISILLTPTLVLAQLSVNYALVPFECEREIRWPVHAVSLVSLAIALAGIAMAWSAWREAGTATPDDRGDPVSQVRFMSLMGAVLSALMALSIFAQWLTTAFIPPCVR